MPTFVFEALDREGARQRGEMQAADLLQARNWLQGKNWIILHLDSKSNSWITMGWARLVLFMGWSKVGLRDLALFTRQLSLLIDSGIHIVKCLDCLGSQTWESPLLGPIAREMSDQLRDGVSLSQALGAYPAVFPPMYVGLVVAGEKSGSFSNTLNQLAGYIESDYKFRARVGAALAYPAIIFSSSLILLTFLLIYVFPRFMSFFDGLSLRLPWTTQQLYVLTLFLTDPWVMILMMIIVPPVLYQIRLFTVSPTGRYLRDRVVLRIPVLAPLHRYAVSARFCRAASVLLECGLGQMQTLELLRGIVASPVLASYLTEMARRIRDEGSSFSKEMLKIQYFPSYCPPMVAVAEEAGRTGEILGRLADTLEEEVDLLAIQALSLLEPIMLGIMGVAVAFVLWSVFVPIYQLVEVL